MVTQIDKIVYTSKFEHDVRKTRDKGVRDKLQEIINKVLENTETGKPLSYALKGERTVRVPPFRLIYAINGNTLILLRFENRSSVYD